MENDSEARKMFHQLRSVSQDVQSLPLESVGRDLSESILRRAKALQPATGESAVDGAIPKFGGPTPKVTIFQTRRSWFWASLAVAAGLLVMVLQPGDENGNNLPAVAQHDGTSTVNRQLKDFSPGATNEPTSATAIDPTQIARSASALPTPAASPAMPLGAVVGAPQSAMWGKEPAPTDLAMFDGATTNDRATDKAAERVATPQLPASTPMRQDALSDTEIRSGQIAGATQPSPPPDNLAETAPLAAAPPSPAAPAPIAGRGGLGNDVGSRFGGSKVGESVSAKTSAAGASKSGGALGGAFSASQSGPQEENEEPRPQVIVHVLAKPEAYQRRSFEKLLASQGVVVEMEHDTDKDERASGRLGSDAKPANQEVLAEKSTIAPTGGEANIDLVLVEAPSSTIASCLTALKNDVENYVGLKVEEPQVATQVRGKVAGVNQSADKKLAFDWSQYSRGNVPLKQKISFQDRFYYRDLPSGERSKPGTVGENHFGITTDERKTAVDEAKQLKPKTRGAAIATGRARHLSISGPEDEKFDKFAARSDASGTQTREDSLARRRTQLELDTGASAVSPDGVQVLFVVGPNREAAASAPAEKAAK